jgi:hypothetical protein
MNVQRQSEYVKRRIDALALVTPGIFGDTWGISDHTFWSVWPSESCRRTGPTVRSSNAPELIRDSGALVSRRLTSVELPFLCPTRSLSLDATLSRYIGVRSRKGL